MLNIITPYIASLALILSMVLTFIKIRDYYLISKKFSISVGILPKKLEAGTVFPVSIFIKCFSREPIIISYTQAIYEKDRRIVFELGKNTEMDYGKEISHYTLDHSIVPTLKKIEVVDFAGRKHKCKRKEIRKVKKKYKCLLKEYSPK